MEFIPASAVEIARRTKLSGTAPEAGGLRESHKAAGRCLYCWRDGLVLHRDHVDPLSRGGEHSHDNIAWVCKSCNSSKGPRFLVEWVFSGRSPYYRRPDPPPNMVEPHAHPIQRVVRVDEASELLECGHVRQPRIDAKTGSDLGKRPKRRCYACPVMGYPRGTPHPRDRVLPARATWGAPSPSETKP